MAKKLTVQDMYNKNGKLFEKMINEKLPIENGKNGFYFADYNGYVAYYVEEETILSCSCAKYNFKNIFERKFNEASNNGYLLSGKTAGRETKYNRSVVRFNCEKTGEVIYLQEKFIRSFPKNTLYYGSSWRAPVLACMEDKTGHIKPFALVCPLNINGLKFIEKEI